MKQRGRKRAADFPDLKVIEGDFSGARPGAPNDLTKRQAEIWKSIVDDEPADFFSTAATRIVLKAFCQSCETLEKLNDTINEFPDDWIKTIKGAKLLSEYCKARALEMRNVATYATKLRLTNQARYTPKAAATASGNTLKGLKPWEWNPP